MIVDTLSHEYGVMTVCELMGVSRSGYYKWKKRQSSSYRSTRDKTRAELVHIVSSIHEKHKTHGYRWTAAYMRINERIEVSDNFVYKCFRHLGIKSETKHRQHYKPRKIKDRYPNLIFSTWDTVDRPRQVVVSDMTAFKFWYYYYEVTFYFDVFNKEILSYQLAERRGHRDQYLNGLETVRSLFRDSLDPVVLHTDQGSVYSSMAYNDLIKDTNIVRSMSRAGKPTDNPVNEALNGWIKEEMVNDFDVEQTKTRQEFKDMLDKYVIYYNTQRPCWAIGYDTPVNYRKRYYRGELERKDTFSKREPTPLPKFVKQRKQKTVSQSNTD